MSPRLAEGRAFRGLARRVRGRPQLICLPYAGGGPRAFSDWTPLVAGHFDVHVAALPGRAGRFGEPVPERLPDLVRDLAAELAPGLGEAVVLFGHSMGATLALEVARELRFTHGVRLRYLAVSGQPAPGTPRRRALHGLDDAELAEMSRGLGGTDLRIAGRPDLWAVLAPILRADLRLVETHEVGLTPVMDCPVVAYGARDDPDTVPELLAGWRALGTAGFATQIFPGDHFYFRSYPEALAADLLKRVLPNCV